MYSRDMIRILALAATAAALLPPAAAAQTAQPYAGLDSRPIKALSTQQIDDLKAGRGMGLALAAELNGYPGPMHVLQLAEQLGLSPEQKTRVTQMFEAMKEEAMQLGDRLVAQEASLDSLFADRRATVDTVAAATAEIGNTQGRLRATHLKYHLSMLQELQPEQIRRYAELRGYAASGTGTPHRHRH